MENHDFQQDMEGCANGMFKFGCGMTLLVILGILFLMFIGIL